VSHIDEEFLETSIAETPAMESALTKMHNKEGAFNDFDYVNESNLMSASAVEEVNKNSIAGAQGGTRYQTLMGPAGKSSFMD